MLLSVAGFDVAGVPFGFPRSCHVDLREVNIVGGWKMSYVLKWNQILGGLESIAIKNIKNPGYVV